MNSREILATIREKNDEITDRFKARIVGIFGSYAKGEQRLDSDLDILYESIDSTQFSFHDLFGLEDYLLELTKASSIDLVNCKRINPVIELEIQEDIQYV